MGSRKDFFALSKEKHNAMHSKGHKKEGDSKVKLSSGELNI